MADAAKAESNAAADSKAKWWWWDVQNTWNQANNVQNEINQYAGQANDAARHRDEDNNKAAADESKSANLQSQAKMMESTMESEQKQKEEAEKDIATATADLNAATEAQAAREKELAEASANLATQKAQMEAAKERHANLEGKVKGLKEKLEKEEKARDGDAGRVQKTLSDKRAKLASLTNLYETEQAAAASSEAKMKDALADATSRRDRAQKDKVAAESEESAAEQSHNKMDARLAAVRAKISDARQNADETARSAVEKAKNARQAAIDAEQEAIKATAAAENEVAVAKAAAKKAKADLASLITDNQNEEAKLAAVLEGVKNERATQEAKLKAEEVQRAADEATVLSHLREAQAKYQDALSKNQVAETGHKLELDRLAKLRAEARLAASKAANRTTAGLKKLEAQRVKLEEALEAAKKDQEKAAQDLANEASNLLNRTRTAQAAIAEIQAARQAAQNAWEIAEARRAEQKKAAENAVALATERRNKVEQTLALERGEHDKEIRAAKNAAQDADNARTRLRRDEERSHMVMSGDIRTNVAVAQHDVGQLEAQRDGAKMEATAAETDLKLKRKELDAVEKERSETVAAINTLREKKASLEAALAEAGAKQLSIKRQTKSSEDALADELVAVATNRQEFAAVDKRREEVQAEVDKAVQRMKQAGNDNAALGADMQRMKSLQNTIASVADAIVAANKRLDMADATKATLQRAITDLTTKKENAECTAAELTKRINARKAAAAVASGSNAELSAKAAKLTKEARDSEAASDAKVKSLDKETGDIKADMGNKLKKLATELKQAESARTATSMQLASETAALVAKARADAQRLHEKAEKALADKKAAASKKALEGKGADHPAAALKMRVEKLTQTVDRLESIEAAKKQGAAGSKGKRGLRAADRKRSMQRGRGGEQQAFSSTGTLSTPTSAIVGEPIAVGGALGVRSANTDIGVDRPIVAPGSAGSEPGPVYGLVPGEVAVPVDPQRLRAAAAGRRLSSPDDAAGSYAPASASPADVKRDMVEAGFNLAGAKDVVAVESEKTGEKVFMTRH